MCTGAELMMVSGGMGAVSSVAQGFATDKLARADAASERYAAEQHALRLRRATRKAVGETRAAIGASGAALDEFSTITTDDIERRGADDASQAILQGQTRAIQQEAYGRNARAGGIMRAGGSLLQGAAYSGWKGTVGPNDPESLSYFYGR